MSVLWSKSGEGQWQEGKRTGFVDEAVIEQIIFDAPSMLPLAGNPSLVPLKRQFKLANGRVDVMAIELGGRPVIIEVKLGSSHEARRAVLGQILAYGAYLEKLPLDAFLAESGPDLGVESEFENKEEFMRSIGEHLENGYFRLVLVLDHVPAELVRTAAYLQWGATSKIWIDLVELRTYEVSGEQVIVPFAVPLPQQPAPMVLSSYGTTSVLREDGSELFRGSLPGLPAASVETLVKLANWAEGLASARLTRLVSAKGNANCVLTLRLLDSDKGLASIWNAASGPRLVLHGTVLAARAPMATYELSNALSLNDLSTKATFHIPLDSPGAASEKLLDLLRAAYEEARG